MQHSSFQREYNKENGQREYIAISPVYAGSTYTGRAVALFTVNAASVGRAGTRFQTKVMVQGPMTYTVRVEY